MPNINIMEVINIETLEEAIKIFYRSGAGTNQASAHDWLTKAQCSQQAWSFVWELMRLDKVIIFKSEIILCFSK